MALPLRGMERVCRECSSLPPDFVQEVASFLLSQDAFPVSALEMVFVLLRSEWFQFPAVDPVSGGWADADTDPFRPHALTVAVQSRLVKQVFRAWARTCERDDLLISDIDLVSLGVCFRLMGLVCGVEASILFQARQDLFFYSEAAPAGCCRLRSALPWLMEVKQRLPHCASRARACQTVCAYSYSSGASSKYSGHLHTSKSAPFERILEVS